MEIRNPSTNMALSRGHKELLEAIRLNRGFDAESYITAKASVLNHYLMKAGLSSVIVAVSGGIDSAVVLGLAVHAKKMFNSPIENIIAVALPATKTPGVTGQKEATQDAQLVCDALGVDMITVDMNPILDVVAKSVERSLGVEGNDWARGQLVSYSRTPTYYYLTSLMSSIGKPGVVLGTTNLSEGGYLGYFGKASDGMVDIQMISDIYKSEVYKVAELLNIPQKIIDRVPTGDMFDACSDEIVFGAPYDYIEIFQELIRDPSNNYSVEMTNDDYAQMHEWDMNLIRMHRYNAHKYLGRSPAVHLDILDCAIEGGWNNTPPESLKVPEVDTTRINGLFTLADGSLPAALSDQDIALKSATIIHPDFKYEEALKMNILKPEEAQQILDYLPPPSEWKNVGRDGYENSLDDGPGSSRATCNSPYLAELLWSRLKNCLPVIRITDGMTCSDTENDRIWRPVGVSNLMRFIRYEDGGELVPHYDRTFVYNNNRRTLMSIVIQLEGHDGATTFIKDSQSDREYVWRHKEDWSRMASDEEKIISIDPKPGQALVFDHGLLHQGEKVSGRKTIIRTDVIFERASWFD